MEYAAYIFGVLYGWMVGLVFLFAVGVLTFDRLREMWTHEHQKELEDQKAKRIRLHLDELERWCASDPKIVETSRWLRVVLENGYQTEDISSFRRRVMDSNDAVELA